MYLGMGWLASLIYYLGLRNANSRRARGLADETILSDQQDATPELASQAAEARAKVAAQDTSFLGGFRALRRRYGECEGGTYATVNEAKEQKGDAYSGFGAWCGRGRHLCGVLTVVAHTSLFVLGWGRVWHRCSQNACLSCLREPRRGAASGIPSAASLHSDPALPGCALRCIETA